MSGHIAATAYVRTVYHTNGTILAQRVDMIDNRIGFPDVGVIQCRQKVDFHASGFIPVGVSVLFLLDIAHSKVLCDAGACQY